MKYRGKIGFATSYEDPDAPGVWHDQIVEKTYTGDVIRDYRRIQNEDRVVTDIRTSNSFSVIGNKFIWENLSKMVYLEYLGVLWKIESFEPQTPRIQISIGGVYNGPTAPATPEVG